MVTATRHRISRTDDPTRNLTILGGEILFKATGEETGGAYALAEMRVPAGYPGPAPHIHEHSDEAFYVISGMVIFTMNGETIEAGPGTYVAVPRMTPHAFRIPATGPARILVQFSPAGFEQYFVALADGLRATGGIVTPALMRDLEARFDTKGV